MDIISFCTGKRWKNSTGRGHYFYLCHCHYADFPKCPENETYTFIVGVHQIRAFPFTMHGNRECKCSQESYNFSDGWSQITNRQIAWDKIRHWPAL